jgi:hypothetical protein
MTRERDEQRARQYRTGKMEKRLERRAAGLSQAEQAKKKSVGQINEMAPANKEGRVMYGPDTSCG